MKFFFYTVAALLCVQGVSAGRHVLQCQPSTSAEAAVEQATAQAISDTLSLAFASVVECADVDIFGKDSTLLSVALSVAISQGAEKIAGECGDDVAAATSAVTNGIVSNLMDSASELAPEAEPLFEARTLVLKDELMGQFSARSLVDLEETSAEKAKEAAEKIVKAIQDILKQLKCGVKDPATVPPTDSAVSPPDDPQQSVPGERCQFSNGHFFGADCK